MERLYLLAPAIVPAVYMVVAYLIFCAMLLLGRAPKERDDRTHSRYFAHLIQYFIWILKPIERAMIALRMTPNSLSITSIVVCAGAGLAIATGHLATAGWLYIGSGVLDVLDGRLARATGSASKSGAFLDSVGDRWGELFVFAGFTWFLRDNNWLLAVILAGSASVLVSYTRARGEGLGLRLDGGIMQRAERMALVSIATLVTAWFGAAPDTAEYSVHVIGLALLIVGVASVFTAVGRYVSGFKQLKAMEGQHDDTAPITKVESESKAS